MKVNVEVNLNDIWPEYDDNSGASLGKQVEENIAYSVKQQVYSIVKDKVEAKMVQAVKDAVEREIDARVSVYIQNYIDNGVMPSSYATTEKKTIKEWAESQLTEQRVLQGIVSRMEQVAKNFTKDMEKKYDMFYATKIVMGLKETGMLEQGKLEQLFNSTALQGGQK